MEFTKNIDIIIPCYNEEEVLSIFYEKISEVIEGINGYRFTMIFVNDGSSDNTEKVIVKLAEKDKMIQYITFSRNFGKEAAIFAGLSFSEGDYAILMDSDLQHPPDLILDFLKGIEEGYDCCVAKRRKRNGEKFFREPFSDLFFSVNNAMSTVKIEKGAVDYRIISKRVVKAILKLSEKERFSKGLFAWAGFDTKWIEYENAERPAGKTKWNFWGLIRYATSGLTAFSLAPLRGVITMGTIISVVAFFYIIVTLVQTFIYGIEVPGYVTTLCAVLFLGGVIEISLGILGEYLGHVYMETKNRPMYVLKDTNIIKKETENKSNEN